MISFERLHASYLVDQSSGILPCIYYEQKNLPYSAESIFDLLADVERYPEFLPGWLSVSIEERQDNLMLVRQKLGVSYLSFEMTSLVKLLRPNQLGIKVLSGPLKELEFLWQLQGLDLERSTNVTLSIKADAQAGPYRRLLDKVMKNISDSPLQCFTHRAQQILTVTSN